jgi:hypothetical protein
MKGTNPYFKCLRGRAVRIALAWAALLAGYPVCAGNPAERAEASLETARALVITGNFDDAALAYSRLVATDSTDAVKNAEFAYVLALEGLYDAALIRLERIRLTNTDPATDYFTHEVITMMGYDGLADALVQGSPPGWILQKGPGYLEKYRRTIVEENASPANLNEQFKQANRLTARNAVYRSLVTFENLIRQAPEEYLLYAGYSIALERAGKPELAAGALDKALVLLKQQPGQESNIAILEKRQTALRQIAGPGTVQPKGNPPITGAGETFSPRMMAYAGGFASSQYISVNGRVGSFFSKSSYATFDFGMTSMNGSALTNLGFTVFDRQKIMVLGVGMTGSFGEGSSLFYGKVSMGPSFMNKKGTASIDIFLDGKIPLKKGVSTQMGLSVGRSIYFGKRK